MKTGKIPSHSYRLCLVVDVEFQDEELPNRDALEGQMVTKNLFDVSISIGNNIRRCNMLAARRTSHRDMEVNACTGSGIKTPVGEATLGRGGFQRIRRNN